jgi:translocation and assembly module TamB
MDFAPEGRAVYRALKAGENVIGRVRTLSGSYKIKGNILSLSGFKAATGSSQAAFSGKLDLSRKVLDMKGLLRTDDINDLAMPYAKGLMGAGECEWTLTGTTDEPEISGNVLFNRVSLNEYFFGAVEGEVSYRKELLRIKELRAESGDKRHLARGTVRFPEAKGLFDVRNPVYGIALVVENGDLRELADARGLDVPVEGNFAADMGITGSGPLPEIAGSARALNAGIYGRPVSSASFGFSYHDKELKLKDASIVAFGSTARLDGMVAGDGRFDFKVSSEGFRLSDLFPEKSPIDYEVKLDARGSGTFREPDVKADFLLSDGTLRGKHMGGGWVQASLKGREVLFEGRLVNGNVSLSGKAALEGDMPWSAELNMDRGRYDFLLGAILKKLPEDLLLSMSGSVSMHGDKDNINASALIKRLNLNLFGQGFMNRSDIAFSVQNRTFSLSEVELRSGNAFIKLGGSIVLDSFYDITVEGSSSLAPLGGFTERIEAVRGNADFIFTARGDWDSPSINGGVSVHGGALGFRGFLQRLSAVEAFIYVDDDRVVIREFSARTGGGNVEAEGVVQLKGIEVEKFLVNTLVDNVSLSVSKGVDMNVGGELVLRGAAGSQVIAGDLQINRARYGKRIEWKSRVLFREKKAPRVERGWFDRVGLNVRVYGKERIFIDNNLARAPLKADIIVGGTIASPRLLGRVEANEGKVYFRNSELDILSATADFVDPESNSPVIRVQAETTVREYHIWLTLDGRAGQFDLTLASDPPLSEEEEILALLTLGERKVFEGMESDIGAAEAASFLTGKFQDVIEERLTDLTGLDRVQIDPYVSGASQSITPKITVSKRLMGERLFVTFSSAVGAETEEELKLEYFLGDNVSLLGGQDVRGSIGGDIKFRFRFR